KLEQGVPEYLYTAAVVVSRRVRAELLSVHVREQFKYDVFASEQHYGVGAAEFGRIGFQRRRGWRRILWRRIWRRRWRRFLSDCRCASLTHFSRTYNPKMLLSWLPRI